jgi:hypothetical protein
VVDTLILDLLDPERARPPPMAMKDYSDESKADAVGLVRVHTGATYKPVLRRSVESKMHTSISVPSDTPDPCALQCNQRSSATESQQLARAGTEGTVSQ